MISPSPRFGLKAFTSEDEMRSIIDLICTPRLGMNGVITRAVNTRLDLR